MAFTLVEVPTKTAKNPNMAISTFFIIIRALCMPHVSCQYTIDSIKAGNMSPSVDKHNAPINEIIKSNRGMATASKTVKKKTEKKKFVPKCNQR